ncbi:MAG TPA: hypothetical protein VNW15_08590 [Rhizomicrobium sp.]|jgi:hypothetical protein|nr:hypothetical protein [Rhizomicrobium sp.]
MAKNQIMFYATAADLSAVLSPIETERPLQYTLMGLFETTRSQTHLSYAGIPDFGRASNPTAAANPSYLLSLQGAQLRSRKVLQKAGGILFGVDQSCNADTIVLRPAGKYGNTVILCGMMGTASQAVTSKILYDFVGKQIRKHFKKSQEFFVGREAFDAWNAGARLTIGAPSPPEFDLKPSN